LGSENLCKDLFDCRLVIFPGDTGEDASWLKGADFLATVKVAFTADGKEYASSAFVLRPHTHGDGHAH